MLAAQVLEPQLRLELRGRIHLCRTRAHAIVAHVLIALSGQLRLRGRPLGFFHFAREFGLLGINLAWAHRRCLRPELLCAGRNRWFVTATQSVRNASKRIPRMIATRLSFSIGMPPAAAHIAA
jgi:hypothetical protein